MRVGICAMAKKSASKPMNEILERLSRYEISSRLEDLLYWLDLLHEKGNVMRFIR